MTPRRRPPKGPPPHAAGEPWPPATRTHALHVLQSDGLAAAHKATGVPKGTIRVWAHKAGVNTTEASARATAKTQAATDATAARTRRILEDAKATMVLDLSALAVTALARSRDLVNHPDTTLRDVVGAFTRAIHDLQLLTGGATDHQVTVVFNSDPPAAGPAARPFVVKELPARLGQDTA